MGNIARYTDLSAELPGVRAHVDVPLDETEFRISWYEAWPVTRSGRARGDAPDSGTRAGEPAED